MPDPAAGTREIIGPAPHYFCSAAKKSLDISARWAHNWVMTSTASFPGYEAHVEGMSEDANEARIERNELAWVSHQIDQTIQTIEFHQNEVQAAERLLAQLQHEAEWRSEQVAEAA